jgi:hypothetical protein
MGASIFFTAAMIRACRQKTKGPTSMELFTVIEKLKKCFLPLEIFDVCTTGYTAHLDTRFKFLPYTRQHGCIDILHSCNDLYLKARIIAAVKNIDVPMLTRVWQELEYLTDVCRVSRGEHIEHC